MTMTMSAVVVVLAMALSACASDDAATMTVEAACAERAVEVCAGYELGKEGCWAAGEATCIEDVTSWCEFYWRDVVEVEVIAEADQNDCLAELEAQQECAWAPLPVPWSRMPASCMGPEES